MSKDWRFFPYDVTPQPFLSCHKAVLVILCLEHTTFNLLLLLPLQQGTEKIAFSEHNIPFSASQVAWLHWLAASEQRDPDTITPPAAPWSSLTSTCLIFPYYSSLYLAKLPGKQVSQPPKLFLHIAQSIETLGASDVSRPPLAIQILPLFSCSVRLHLLFLTFKVIRGRVFCLCTLSRRGLLFTSRTQTVQ